MAIDNLVAQYTIYCNRRGIVYHQVREYIIGSVLFYMQLLFSS